MTYLHDAVVVGAGPAGSAVAAFLARAGLDVLLLDKANFPRDKACGDLVSPIGVSILGTLGLQPALGEVGFCVNAASITAPRGESVHGPVPSHPDHPNYGYIVKRIVLDDLIRQAALRAGARFEGQFHVRDIRLDDGQALTVIGEQRNSRVEARGRLVILAVGASLPLLQSVGLVTQPIGFAYAARAYFGGLPGLDQCIHIHFDGVPLPGGGWIFPLSDDTANVGTGFYYRSQRTPPTAAQALACFLAHPPIRARLEGAHQIGPIKGFPLRTDFHRSPTTGPRMLLVGEAAGLVNPLTGEGIHYALESAQIASQCVQTCFEQADFSPAALRNYDRALRVRFQRMFVFAHRLRQVYMNAFLIDPMVRVCNRWPEVAQLMVGILLSYQDPAVMLRPGVIIKALRSLRPTPRSASQPGLAGE